MVSLMTEKNIELKMFMGFIA